MSCFNHNSNFASRRQVVSLLVLALFVLMGQTANAQVEKGVITGTVKDSTGAVVQNAQVTLQNMPPGIRR